MEAEPAKSQLQSALQMSQVLSDVAKNQQTDPLEIFENLKSLIEQIEQQDQKKAAAFKQAIMILTAPQSIVLSTQQDIHLSADGQISHIAGESISLSTQQSLIVHASQKLSLFAAQDGASLYAGKGKVEIQAQGDEIDVIARKGIKIISTEDQIEITAAKKIVLTAGGSQIEISNSGILPTTGGKFEVKAGQHLFVKGSQVNTSLPALPSFKNQNWIALEHLDADNQPFSSVGYKIFFEGNQIIEGQLDDQGKAHHNNVPEKAIRVEYEQAEIIDKPWDTYDLVLDQLDKIEE